MAGLLKPIGADYEHLFDSVKNMCSMTHRRPSHPSPTPRASISRTTTSDAVLDSSCPPLPIAPVEERQVTRHRIDSRAEKARPAGARTEECRYV
jgi:hypothetical protein